MMHPQALFTIFGRGVYLYGIFIAVGILCCFLVFFLYTKKMKIAPEIQDYTLYIAIIAIAGGFGFAALYQAVYQWIVDGYFSFNGITAMGGFIGGALTFIVFYFLFGKYLYKGKKAGLHKKEFNKIFTVAPICITIAHAFGRLGCLMAGCCYGKKSSTGFTLYINGANRIPVQLYESLFLFALFGILTLLYFKRFNITMHVYLIAYGCWRFFIEFFRGDDEERKIFMGLGASQWQSFIFVGAGIALLIFYVIKKIPLRLPKEKESK